MGEVKSVVVSYWDKINNICVNNGTVLVGFMPRESRIDKTKCKLYCKEHKEYWETTCISNILTRKTTNCKQCTKEKKTQTFLKSEECFLKETLSACDKYETEFLSWVNGYTGAFTQIRHRCKEHGVVTESTHARSLIRGLNKTSGCSECNKLTFKEIADGRYSRHVQSFMDTGSFVSGTIFKKSERVTKCGIRNYWNVFCPRCAETNESFVGSLNKGSLPCSCGKGDYGYYPARVNDPDQLYLLRLSPRYGEIPYYKIGRSFKTETRLSNIKNPADCEGEIVSRWYSRHQEVYDREQELHLLCNSSHMVPKVHFKGCITECFTADCLSHPEVIKTFNL